MSNFAVAASSLAALMRILGPTIPIRGLSVSIAVKTPFPEAIWVSTATPLFRVLLILRGTAGTGSVAPYIDQATLLAHGYQYVRLGPTSIFRTFPTHITDGTSNTILIGETSSAPPTAPLPAGSLPPLSDATTNPILFV